MASENIIRSKIQEILNNKHSNRYKREIIPYHQRLNFACPVCGDSKKVDTKKRGNVYLKNMRYKCFNCGVSLPLNEFFDQMNVKIDPTTLLEINNQIDAYRNQQPTTTALTDFQLDKIISLSDLSERLNSTPRYKLMHFGPVQRNSEVGKYLIEERRIKNTNHFYQAVYMPSPNRHIPVLVSLNKYQDYILGIQIRNLEFSRKKRFYKIYNFEELWNFFPEKEKLSEDELTRYNKLSYCYNILNVDFDQTITLFEGYIDAIFFPNSIGLVGTNTDYSFLLDESLNVRFFFDNDNAGKKKTREMLMKGYPVFLWNNFIKDLASKSKDPDAMYYKLNKQINDLNKLAQKVENPYYKLKLEEYFSKDNFDLIGI